eukprot:augustus_masked-scaffold_15-processed-gene-4.16-mRNA-1 protein AED:1.00 eAED:1.00 QI:0/-1/0/0/-1/1/1/0/723
MGDQVYVRRNTVQGSIPGRRALFNSNINNEKLIEKVNKLASNLETIIQRVNENEPFKKRLQTLERSVKSFLNELAAVHKDIIKLFYMLSTEQSNYIKTTLDFFSSYIELQNGLNNEYASKHTLRKLEEMFNFVDPIANNFTLLMCLAFSGKYVFIREVYEFSERHQIKLNLGHELPDRTDIIACAIFSDNVDTILYVLDICYEKAYLFRRKTYPATVNVIHLLANTNQHEIGKVGYKKILEKLEFTKSLGFYRKPSSSGLNILHSCIIFNNFQLFQTFFELLNKAVTDESSFISRLSVFSFVSRDSRGGLNALFCCGETYLFRRDDRKPRDRFARLLIENGANCNSTLNMVGVIGHGWSVLMFFLQTSVYGEHPKQTEPLVKLLIKNGANLFYKIPNGLDPFQLAFASNALSIIKIILQENAKLQTPAIDLNKRFQLYEIHPATYLASSYVESQRGVPEIQDEFWDVLFDHGMLVEPMPDKSGKVDSVQLLFYRLAFLKENDVRHQQRLIALVRKFVTRMDISDINFDIDFRYGNSLTPLMICVVRGFYEIFLFFVSLGSNLHLTLHLMCCSLKSPHRITSETLAPGKAGACDLCMARVKEGRVIKKCENDKCDTWYCDRCLFFMPNGNTDINVFDLAERNKDQRFLQVLQISQSKLFREFLLEQKTERSTMRLKKAKIFCKYFSRYVDSGLADIPGMTAEQDISALLDIEEEDFEVLKEYMN